MPILPVEKLFDTLLRKELFEFEMEITWLET